MFVIQYEILAPIFAVQHNLVLTTLLMLFDDSRIALSVQESSLDPFSVIAASFSLADIVTFDLRVAADPDLDRRSGGGANQKLPFDLSL